MGTTHKRGAVALLAVVGMVLALLAPAAGAVGPTMRLAGPDRYATAVAVSQYAYPAGASTVYIATGENFPDALAGGVAADEDGGPILLVRQNLVPPVTSSELTRLAPTKIVILGGTGAVSAAVETALGGFATTERLWGLDRFATAAAVSADAFPSGAGTVLLANGFNFPDALAGVPAGAKLGAPILLTRPTLLPAATATEITSLGASKVVILGGTVAVSAAVATAVGALPGVTTVERWSAADRYGTAAEISKAIYPCGTDTAYVAYGLNFPDALAGGPAAALEDGPVLLVRTDSIPPETYNEIRRLRASQVVILGGIGVVSDTTRADLETLLALPIFEEPPTVTITSPPNLSTYKTTWQGSFYGTNVAFTATATDPNCDAVTVIWSSSVNGPLGTGLSINPLLSIPFGQDSSQPTITATAIDSLGATDADSIEVKLFVPSP